MSLRIHHLCKHVIKLIDRLDVRDSILMTEREDREVRGVRVGVKRREYFSSQGGLLRQEPVVASTSWRASVCAELNLSALRSSRVDGGVKCR